MPIRSPADARAHWVPSFPPRPAKTARATAFVRSQSLVALPTVQSVAEANLPVFTFFRRRAAFITTHAGSDAIEAYVVWGAAVDALMRIHARRVGRDVAKNRRCFVDGLLDLAPELGVVSLPLLCHDLGPIAPELIKGSPLHASAVASATKRIWRADEDTTATAELIRLRSSQPGHVQRLFDGNRYAEILYDEYRCCAVHGLDLGWKTFPNMDRLTGPGYMNCSCSEDEDSSPDHRCPTRIIFPLEWLAQLLGNLTAKEEELCTSNGWTVPRHPTLQD